MSENGSHTAASPPREHNLTDIKQIIVECRDSMVAIREQRRGLNEQAGEIRQRLKDAGVDNGVFMQSVRIFEMDKEARAGHMTAFQICYEAMNEGGQLDWVNAVQEDPTLEGANQQGIEAGLAGADVQGNPYPKGSSLNETWQAGWEDGQAQLAAKAGQPPAPPVEETAAEPA